VDLLRQIRLIKDDEERVILSKEGKTDKMGLTLGKVDDEEAGDWTTSREQGEVVMDI
jgi:hypothetical protein